MDQEMMARGGPELGMYACDQEMFARIWKRVMPEERPGCPISVDSPAEEVHTHSPAPAREPAAEGTAPAPARGSMPEGTAPAPAREPMPEGAAPEPAREAMPEGAAPEPAREGMPEGTAPEPVCEAMPEGAVPDSPECAAPEGPCAVQPPSGGDVPESACPTGDDFPRRDAVPCLGSGSAGHGQQLQEDIRAALEGWQLYRHLARKVTGSASRTLSALASEKHKQARKLGAAYFLISGVRYWPTDRLETPHTASWLGTLRRRFAEEQQLDSRWRAASLDTEDACLAELYSELAENCAAHAGVLRALLENAL